MPFDDIGPVPHPFRMVITVSNNKRFIVELPWGPVYVFEELDEAIKFIERTLASQVKS